MFTTRIYACMGYCDTLAGSLMANNQSTFHLDVSVHTGGGRGWGTLVSGPRPIPNIWSHVGGYQSHLSHVPSGGTPVSGLISFLGGTKSQSQDRGTPWLGLEYPPPPRGDRSTHLAGTEVPSPPNRTSNRQCKLGRYASCVFMQEDFLVMF